KHSFIILWLRFREINKKLAYQCSEISGNNRFWSVILTAQFLSNMGAFNYLLYVSLFVEATLDQLIYFVFFMVEIGMLIFLVIFRCSMVDHHNDLCYAKNVKVCILFERYFGRKISAWKLAHVSLI